MPQAVNHPLESYLLSTNGPPIDCLVCGESNSASGDRCCRCRSPLALARQAATTEASAIAKWCARPTRPHLIAVVGAAGAGKTVYLGMLMDLLVRGVGGLRVTLRGSFSVDLQQTATNALAASSYPEKTVATPEHWAWACCRVECRRGGRPVELVLADIAGDAWADEAESPGRHPALSALLDRASAVVALADVQRLHAGDHAADFVTRKLLAAAQERRSANAKRRTEPPTLALVLTKGDACQSALDAPDRFAEAHAAALLQDCRSRFPNTRVFATAVAGASAWREAHGHRRDFPLRIEPRGVVEPIGWLVTQLT